MIAECVLFRKYFSSDIEHVYRACLKGHFCNLHTPHLQRAFFERALGNLMKILGLQMILKSAGMKGNLL